MDTLQPTDSRSRSSRHRLTFQPWHALGYRSDDWEALRRDPLLIAQTQEARLGPETEHGEKYEVRAILRGPVGRAAEVIGVLMIRRGETAPAT